MVYSVLSALAIACILIFDGVIIKNIFVLRGTERTKYVRSFKQGECAVIYFIAVPLFYMGLLFEKENWFFGIFKALENSAKMVILDFGYEEVSTLSESNIIFKIAILVCFLSAAFNSALLFISLLSQYLDYAFDLFRWKFTRKNRVIFAGNNESNRFAVKTAKKAALAMIFDDISKDAASELFTERVPYINTPNLSDYICERLSEALYGKGRLTIVINTEDDSENIVLAGKVLSVLESFVKTTIGRDTDQHTDKEKSFIVDNFRRISIFVVKNPSFSSIYDELERDSFGCIHSFSKYEQIALDFMQKYPFSLYMGEEIIDKENALVKEDAIIQYQLFGLGKVNEEILFSGISENQFLMKKMERLFQKIWNITFLTEAMSET